MKDTCFPQRTQLDPLPEVRDPGTSHANPFACPFDTRKAQRLLGWQPAKSWCDFRDW
jgi:hypothetical protein